MGALARRRAFSACLRGVAGQQGPLRLAIAARGGQPSLASAFGRVRLTTPAFGLLRPVLRALDPETAHRATIRLLKSGLAGDARRPSRLSTRLFGLDFPNPLGLAAGFDKDAEVPLPLLKLGFGFVEVGTVTPLPQPGNPRPRLFRL